MSRVHQQGFTLIEVLIAMTLLSVMVVLLFSSLQLAGESWNAGEKKMTEVNQKAVVYQFFKRHLTTIRPLPMLNLEQDFSPENVQAFQGFPQSLRFVAALPASSARKGLQLFTIAPDPVNRSTLMVSLQPYQLLDVDQEPSKPEILLEGLAALNFAYFGKTEDVADAQWRKEWTIADRLPMLIKVSIQLTDGSYWPEMIFALKISKGVNADAAVADNGNKPLDASTDAP